MEKKIETTIYSERVPGRERERERESERERERESLVAIRELAT